MRIGLDVVATLWGLLGVALLVPAGCKVLALSFGGPWSLADAAPVALVAALELLASAFGFAMMYAFFRFRRWAWWAAVVSTGLLVAFFTLELGRAVIATGRGVGIGDLWAVAVLAGPVGVLSFCLTPAARKAMVR